MIAMLRQFRRAPGRILASIFALALAVGAIGVLAIPTVSEGTLHEAAEQDGLADIVVATTPIDRSQLAALEAIDGVAAVDGETSNVVEFSDGTDAQLVGLDLDRQRMNLLHVIDGRLPAGPGEIVANFDLAPIGASVDAGDTTYTVVGHGGTLWWSDTDAVFTALDPPGPNAPTFNRLAVTAVDDGIGELRSISDQMRDVLADGGDTYVNFPDYLPDGSTPIDGDIEQISFLIGMLGVVAGIVAMVLLASTTNTLITERTREVAVMRALGGQRRPLRRRLRRIALAITGLALVVGLPLGVFVSNYIARMVLEQFVGITPDFAIDWWVVGGSVVAMLVGARLVAARAARRVTKVPLAEALRDREASPFGRRWTQRLAAKIPTGGMLGRLAARASIHRPARTFAVTLQIAAAVGSAFLIPSLVSSVNEFNTATFERWTWESQTEARDPGLPFDAIMVDEVGGDEAAILADSEIVDDEVWVYGVRADTTMFDPVLDAGAWIEPGTDQAVVSAGFAEHRDVAIGDRIDVELASGTASFELVGTADDHNVALYVDRDGLAAELGSPGMANLIWSHDDQPGSRFDVVASTSTAADLAEEDEAARDAVVLIFGAIGLIVAGVAALAVVSSLMVDLFERRHELAALQAIGASRRRLRGLLVRELVPIALVGSATGLAAGAWGARAIIGSFEAADGIDIGVTLATGTIPIILAVTALGLFAIAAIVVRGASRRPVAVTLRGAA